MNVQTITPTFRIIILVCIVLVGFPTKNVGEAWYEAAAKEERIVEKDKKDTKKTKVIHKKSSSHSNNKKRKNWAFWNIVLGFSLSMLIAFFPGLQVFFIIPMCLTLVRIIVSYYTKPNQQRKPKIAKNKRKNQVQWTILLGVFASLLLFIISLPYAILFSLIPLFVALLSLLISSSSVKKGKSGASCLVMSIILSVCFILLAAGLLYLILYAFD